MGLGVVVGLIVVWFVVVLFVCFKIEFVIVIRWLGVFVVVLAVRCVTWFVWE